jgi:hypothetical protein
MDNLPINLELQYPPLGPGELNREAHFPTLHYEGPEELDLPQDGLMTVKYHVKRETSEVDRKTGKHCYYCDIEVLSIEKVKSDEAVAPAKSGSEAADALDKLMAEQEDGEDDANEENEY